MARFRLEVRLHLQELTCYFSEHLKSLSISIRLLLNMSAVCMGKRIELGRARKNIDYKPIILPQIATSGLGRHCKEQQLLFKE